MRWNTEQLDSLLDEMRERVKDGIDEAHSEEGDEDSPGMAVAECIGYWMYRLMECRISEQQPAEATK